MMLTPRWTAILLFAFVILGVGCPGKYSVIQPRIDLPEATAAPPSTPEAFQQFIQSTSIGAGEQEPEIFPTPEVLPEPLVAEGALDLEPTPMPEPLYQLQLSRDKLAAYLHQVAQSPEGDLQLTLAQDSDFDVLIYLGPLQLLTQADLDALLPPDLEAVYFKARNPVNLAITGRIQLI